MSPPCQAPAALTGLSGTALSGIPPAQGRRDAVDSILVSLPNNYYYGTQDDSWVYDVETQLKPDPAPRYGDLEIIKTLSSYNQTFGPAFFVFSVEAERNGKNVYSDVVSINFTEPGIKIGRAHV